MSMCRGLNFCGEQVKAMFFVFTYDPCNLSVNVCSHVYQMGFMRHIKHEEKAY